MLSRQHDLQTVFAGVTGTADKPVARRQALKGLEVADQCGAIIADNGFDQFQRLRALHSDHRQLTALGQVHGKGVGLLAHPGQVFFSSRGIDYHAVAITGQVDNQVVDNAALLVQHAAVQRLARGLQTRHVVGQQVLQVGLRFAAIDIDHSHVRHIKHADGATYLMVFFQL